MIEVCHVFIFAKCLSCAVMSLRDVRAWCQSAVSRDLHIVTSRAQYKSPALPPRGRSCRSCKMGNKQSILCCSPSCCSTRRSAVRPVRGDVHRRLETPSEHSKTSDTPKRASGTSAGNGGSPTNISDPETQLNINQEKEKIQHKISKELKIKDGAERIRKLIKNEKHLQEVDDVLYESTRKLDVFYRRLQHLNACIPERDALHLPRMCEDWNEENAVLPAHEAMNHPQVSNMDNVIPVEDIINEPEVINVDNASPVEEIMNETEKTNGDDGNLLEEYINELIESIFEKVFLEEEIINEPEKSNEDNGTQLEEYINKLIESIFDKAFLEIISEPEKSNENSGTLLEEYINELIESIFDKAFLEIISAPEKSKEDDGTLLEEYINELIESIFDKAFLVEETTNEPEVNKVDNASSVEEIMKETEKTNEDDGNLLEEYINELIESIFDKAFLVEETTNEPEKSNEDNGTLLEEILNEPIESIIDNVSPVEEIINELEVINVDKALLPVDEETNDLEITNLENIVLQVDEGINDLEESIVEDTFHPEELLPELEMPNTYNVFQLQPPLSLEDFYCCSVLGRGAFGKVLLAEHKDSKKMVAIKTIKKMDVIVDEMVDCLMCEKRIFQAASRGHHPFLVNLIASFQNFHYIFFVMEYAAGGDLWTHLDESSGSFSTSRARFYTACIVLGLEYLHEQKIVHRDLKLGNIVLDHEGFAKITDFGLGKDGIGFGDQTSSPRGTLIYVAPEILTKPSYTQAVDWWSLGVLLYVMLLGKFPFSGDDDKEVKKNITSGKIRYPLCMARRSRRILRSFLKRNPDRRLGASKDGAEDVKNHPFFREIDWSDLFSRKAKPPFVPTIEEDTRKLYREFSIWHRVLTPPYHSPTEEEQDTFRDFDWIAD